jgi:hypothetical protein
MEGVMQNRRHEEIRRGRLDRAKEVVIAHIARVCGHMSPEELDVLVTRMATIDVKYSMRRSEDFFAHREDNESTKSHD